MKTISFELESTSPLLMQSDALADPLNHYAKEIKLYTGKHKKTDDDHRRIGELEFIAGLYFEPDQGPIIPSRNVERMLRDAGALSRKGKDVQRGLFVKDDNIPLLYDGPRHLEELVANRKFHDRRTVVIKKARTVRERPIFRDWKLKLEIDFDEGIFNRAHVIEIMTKAGQYVGLGTFRPRYGRFNIAAAN